MDRKIEEFDKTLSYRAYRLLKWSGINYESEVKQQYNKLINVKGMGKNTLEEIRKTFNIKEPLTEKERLYALSESLLLIINLPGIEEQIGTAMYEHALDLLQEEGLTDKIITN